MSPYTKPAASLRIGDRIKLARSVRLTQPATERTHAEVLRIANGPYGMTVQCAHGIWITLQRYETVEVEAAS